MNLGRILLAACAAALAVASCSSPSSTAGSSGATDASGGTKGYYPLTFTQFDGTTATITAMPTRIVTVDNPSYSMDEVVALGVKPIGGLVYPSQIINEPGSPYDSRGIPKEISGQITSFTSVGTAPESPDLEKIVALHPDLIVAVNGPLTSNLQQLEAIAPVVNLNPNAAPSGTGIDRLPWVAELRLLARVLDRQRQLDAFLAQFEAAAAQVRPKLAGKSASVVFPNLAQGTVNVDGPDYNIGLLLGYLGVKLPPLPHDGSVVNGTGGGLVSLSIEHASELTGQYLIDAQAVSNTDTQALLSNPVVAQLPSVKAGRVILAGPGISFDGGFAGAGPVGQLQAIPHIAKAFETAG